MNPDEPDPREVLAETRRRLALPPGTDPEEPDPRAILARVRAKRELARAAFEPVTGSHAPSIPGLAESVAAQSAPSPVTPAPARRLERSGVPSIAQREAENKALADLERQALANRSKALNFGLGLGKGLGSFFGQTVGALLPNEMTERALGALEQAAPSAGGADVAGRLVGNMLPYGALYSGLAGLAAKAPVGSLAEMAARGINSPNLLARIGANIATGAPLDIATGIVEANQSTGQKDPIRLWMEEKGLVSPALNPTAFAVGRNLAFGAVGAAAFEGVRQPFMRSGRPVTVNAEQAAEVVANAPPPVNRAGVPLDVLEAEGAMSPAPPPYTPDRRLTAVSANDILNRHRRAADLPPTAGAPLVPREQPIPRTGPTNTASGPTATFDFSGPVVSKAEADAVLERMAMGERSAASELAARELGEPPPNYRPEPGILPMPKRGGGTKWVGGNPRLATTSTDALIAKWRETFARADEEAGSSTRTVGSMGSNLPMGKRLGLTKAAAGRAKVAYGYLATLEAELELRGVDVHELRMDAPANAAAAEARRARPSKPVKDVGESATERFPDEWDASGDLTKRPKGVGRRATANPIDVRNAGAEAYNKALQDYYDAFDGPFVHRVNLLRRLGRGESLDAALSAEGLAKPAGIEAKIERLLTLEQGVRQANVAAGLITPAEQARLDDKYPARPPIGPDLSSERGALGARGGQTDTPEFKAWFGESAVRDESGAPKVVYHGAGRPDRIGGVFRRSRATSGPMAFFTDDPAIASNYAQGKADTSLEHPTSYTGWFKWKPKGARTAVNIDRAWWYLSPEQRARIAELAPRVGTPDEGGDIILREVGHTSGLGGYDWHLKEAKGNHLKALVDEWLESGSLYDNEGEFLDVLKLAGLDGAEFASPHARMPSVYPVYLNIRRPLVTNDIPDEVMGALESASRRQPIPEMGVGVDPWDKRNHNPREWFAELRKDQGTGKNSHAWSSIPDWVTRTLKKLGYDGIHDTGGKMGGPSHDVWIPFEETQVKSAIGNSGAFDPRNPNITGKGAVPIMGSITGAGLGGAAGYATGDTPEERKRNALLGALAGAAAFGGLGYASERIGIRYAPRVRDWASRTYQSLLNDVHAADEFGRRVGQTEDVAHATATARGWRGRADWYIGKRGPTVGGPLTLKQVMLSAKGVEPEVIALATYRHALELEAAGMADKGVDLALARQNIPLLEADPRVKAAADMLHAFYRRLLDDRLANGLLNQAQYDAIIARGDYYVPFVREWAVEQRSRATGGGKLFNRGSGVRRMDPKEVASSAIVNPFEQAVRDAQSTARDIGRQRVMNVVGDILTAHPAEAAPYLVDHGPMHGPPPLHASIQERVITPVINGVKHRVEVTDPDLFAALQSSAPATESIFKKLLTVPKRLLQAGVTMHPEFGVGNATRDAFFSSLQYHFPTASAATGTVLGAGVGAATAEPGERTKGALIGAGIGLGGGVMAPHLLRTVQGLSHVLRYDDLYQQWLKEGGSGMGMYVKTPADAQKLVRRLTKQHGPLDIINPKSWWDALTFVNEAIEQAPRVARFQDQLAKGASPMAASASSRDISVDFGRKGADPLVRGMADVTAFWNPNIQGLDKLRRTLFTRNSAKTWAMGAAVMTAPSLALFALNKDDPAYWDRPLWERNLFWLVPAGTLENGETRFIRVPKPFEPGYIFASIPERLAEFAYQRDPERTMAALKDMLGKSAGAFLPIPTGIKPVAEAAVNFDTFRQRPVVPQGIDQLPPSRQILPQTSVAARAAGAIGEQVGIPISPIKADHLIRGLTGPLGAGALEAVVDPLARLTGLDRGPQPPARPLVEWSRFVTKPNGFGTDDVQTMFRRFDRAEQWHTDITRRANAGDPTVAEAVRAHREDLILYGQLKDFVATFRDLSAARREVVASRTMTPEEKRAALLRLGEAAAELATKAVNGMSAQTPRRVPFPGTDRPHTLPLGGR